LLASSNNVKLRLGIVNTFSEQKGVDAKIVTDLSDLARNRAISEAVLVGGDEDLRIGMELAQQYGVRVHLLTIEGSTCSTPLRQESDSHSTIATDVIRTFLSITAPPATTIALPAAAATPAPITAATATGPAAITTALNAVVTSYLSTLAGPEQAALRSAIQTGTGVPSEHDGRILATARTQLRRPLENAEKTALRGILKAQLGV
jgi:NYN domain